MIYSIQKHKLMLESPSLSHYRPSFKNQQKSLLMGRSKSLRSNIITLKTQQDNLGIKRNNRNPFLDQKKIVEKNQATQNKYLSDQYQINNYTRMYDSKFQNLSQNKTNQQFPSFSSLKNILQKQEKIMQKMRQKCESEKQKIERDFQIWQQTLINYLSDFKTSVVVSIDYEYRKLVEHFKQIKINFIEYCKIKKNHFKEQQQKNLENFRFPERQDIDNENLLAHLDKDLKFCTRHLKYDNFAKIQQKILIPVLLDSEQLLNHLQIQNIYQIDKMNKFMVRFNCRIQKQFHKMYGHIKQFINCFQYKDNTQNKEEKRPKSITNLSFDSKISHKVKQTNSFKPFNINALQTAKFPKNNINISAKSSILSNPNCQISQQLSPQFIPIRQYNRFKYQPGDTYSSTLGTNQNQKNPWINKQNFEIADLRKQKKLSNQQTALVICYLMNWNQICVGTKNGYLKIFCAITLQQIQKMKVFQTSVCSIANLSNKYIALGSDYGPSQIALWDIYQQSFSYFHNNNTAITALVNLEDDHHFLSTSLDSTIKVYEMIQKLEVYQTKNSQKISGCILSNSKQQIITCHLSNSINIWKILRDKQSNKFMALTLARQISLKSIPTCLSNSPQRKNQIILGQKDHTLKVIDLISGKQTNNFQVKSQIYDLIINNIDSSIKGCIGCLKNGNIIYLDLKNKNIKLIGKGCQIRHVYGINPKAIVTRQGQVFVCNHQQKTQTQINSWKIFNDF